jgi:hypothetical protein
MTRHGRDCPSMCSLCAGATPRRISIADGMITIDGEDVRANDEPVSVQVASARRRGSEARRRK